MRSGTTCDGSTVDPIFEIDTTTGKVLKTFGGGLLIVPHDIFVDQDDHDNVWIADQSASKAKDKGEQVWKFSPDGKVLMTLGQPGKTGDTPDTFNDPTSVVTGKNGDIFVADGHGSGPRQLVARVVKFDKTGKFIKVISQRGSDPGSLSEPHSITIDSKGRLFVADRGNVRISIFSTRTESFSKRGSSLVLLHRRTGLTWTRRLTHCTLGRILYGQQRLRMHTAECALAAPKTAQ